MNKKLIAIIVGTIAVLSIVLISIFGSNPENTDRIYNVISIVALSEQTELETYTDEDGVTVVKTVEIIDPEQDDYQISWLVLPANATNKTVTVTSDNLENATVELNETGALITFIQRNDSVITISSTDGTNKKAKIHFTFPAPTESEVLINLSEGTFESDYLQVDQGTLVMLTGTTYNLNIPETTVEILEEDKTATIVDGNLTTSGAEEFVLRFTQFLEDEGVFYQDIPVRVIHYVQQFAIGSHYSSYLQTMSSFDLPQEQPAINFLNKTKQAYLVGSENEYRFNIALSGRNSSVLTQADVELVYVVTNLDNEPVDLSTIASLNGNMLTFNSSAVGNTYKFAVSLKNNIMNRNTLNFTIQINEGVNVWTSEELYNTFKDLSVEMINLHTNLLVTPRENQLTTLMYNGVEETRLNNFGSLAVSDALRADAGTLYPRYIPSTYTGINEIVVNGNFFNLNAENVPLYSPESGAGNLPWSNQIASVQEGLFSVQDGRSVANVNENNYAKVTYNNLKLTANSAKGPIYTLDDQGDLEGAEENERITRQGSGLIGFVSRNSKATFNNTVVTKTIFSYWSAYAKTALELDYALTYDVWGGGIYGYGTSEISMSNSTFRRLGASAISLEEISYSIESSEAYLDPILTIGPNVVFDNYLSGLEGWFVVNGFVAAVPTLKTIVNDTLNQVGKSMIKYDQDIQSETFNYILQIISRVNDHKPAPVENYPNVDMQYTVRVYNEATQEYMTVVRKNGFINSHPFSAIAGGRYLGALGTYSNLESFKAQQHVVGMVNGYLTNDAQIMPVYNNPGLTTYTNPIMARIDTLFSALTGGAPVIAYPTLPSSTQQQLLLAISVDEEVKSLIATLFGVLDVVDSATSNALKTGFESAPATAQAVFAIGFVLDPADVDDILEVLTTFEVPGIGNAQLALFVGFFDMV